MKLLKIVVFAVLILAFTISLLDYFSPYRNNNIYPNRALIQSITIKKPPSVVFNYLGNSDNASNWSVYVNHITPLNTQEIEDGKIGSIRRCFKNKNETGIYWDEEIIKSITNEKRTLSVYNLNGFWFTAHSLKTEQLYKETEGNCKLSFTLFSDNKNTSFLNELKLSLGSYFIKSIFEENIKNIKQIIEKE